MAQMKEQNRTPEIKLNKMDTYNLPDARVQKTLAISMLSELGGRVGELSENVEKEIRNIKTKRENIKLRTSLNEYTN